MGVGQALSVKLKNVHLPNPHPNGGFWGGKGLVLLLCLAALVARLPKTGVARTSMKLPALVFQLDSLTFTLLHLCRASGLLPSDLPWQIWLTILQLVYSRWPHWRPRQLFPRLTNVNISHITNVALILWHCILFPDIQNCPIFVQLVNDFVIILYSLNLQCKKISLTTDKMRRQWLWEVWVLVLDPQIVPYNWQTLRKSVRESLQLHFRKYDVLDFDTRCDPFLSICGVTLSSVCGY